MEIRKGVNLPVSFLAVVAQVPAISGAIKGIKDFNGNVQDGWAGYGIGIFYSQIGIVISILFIWIVFGAIERYVKD
jgi:hypothetical protein